MSDDNTNNLSMETQWNESALKNGIEYLKQCYASLEIRIDDPRFALTEEPVVIKPAPLEDDPNQLEFVYTILDYGDRLMASKQSENQIEDLSMLRMYYTIEKMICVMSEKLHKIEPTKNEDLEKEILFYLEGHQLCMRKAFEVIINLPDNWVVMNFDPGTWGNNYLATLQRLRDKNFDYPPPAPRDYFRYRQGKLSGKPKYP